MSYEVEQKFPVDDHLALQRKLAALGANVQPPIEQIDRYYAHPSRDFAATDEALRIRRVGSQNCLTYKGPKIDAATKTRREIEVPLASGQAAEQQFAELLEALGFRPVIEVRKQRRVAHVAWRNRQVEACLDQVDGLGHFAELELVAEAEELNDARAALSTLAEELGLRDSERRSYLELLLEVGIGGR